MESGDTFQRIFLAREPVSSRMYLEIRAPNLESSPEVSNSLSTSEICKVSGYSSLT